MGASLDHKGRCLDFPELSLLQLLLYLFPPSEFGIKGGSTRGEKKVLVRQVLFFMFSLGSKSDSDSLGAYILWRYPHRNRCSLEAPIQVMSPQHNCPLRVPPGRLLGRVLSRSLAAHFPKA